MVALWAMVSALSRMTRHIEPTSARSLLLHYRSVLTVHRWPREIFHCHVNCSTVHSTNTASWPGVAED
jgi:hypothetical protein